MKTQMKKEAMPPFSLSSLARNKENYYFCHKITTKTMETMEQQADIRWLQRYSNFHKACQRLIEVTESGRTIDDLSELEQEGLVQRFAYTFELSWKVMQDLLIFKGYEFMLGPNGTLKMAFEDGLISDHDGWRQMAKSRNMLSHVYDEEEADAIVRLIFSRYAPLLKSLDEKLGQLSKDKEYLQS